MEGTLENLLGRYAGKGSWCECGKRTNNGSQEAWVLALTLSRANSLILEDIIFPIGKMRANGANVL